MEEEEEKKGKGERKGKEKRSENIRVSYKKTCRLYWSPL